MNIIRTVIGIGVLLASVLTAHVADAARYWVTTVGVSIDLSNGTSYVLSMDVAYLGTDVLAPHNRRVYIVTQAFCTILYTDTAAQIRTKVTDCVVAEAQHVPNNAGTLGVTVNRTEGWLPSFITGQ